MIPSPSSFCQGIKKTELGMYKRRGNNRLAEAVSKQTLGVVQVQDSILDSREQGPSLENAPGEIHEILGRENGEPCMSCDGDLPLWLRGANQ
jgi:hypothetical protein